MYDDDRDALAAEYVLGTLSADEREQAEALLVIDPGFAEIVRLWERRLGELNVMVEAVEPPPDVWEKIQAEISGTKSRNAANVEAVLPALEEAVTQTAPDTEAEGEPTPVEELSPALLPDTEPEAEPEPEPEPEPEYPQDLDDAAAVAALASSLLPPEPAPAEKPKPSAALPPPPPPQRVDRGAGRGVERSAEVIYLRRQARRWRGVTVVMSALAAVLALFIVVSQLAPGLIAAAAATASGGGAAAAARLAARCSVAAGADRARFLAHGRSAKPHDDGAQVDGRCGLRPQLRTVADRRQ